MIIRIGVISVLPFCSYSYFVLYYRSRPPSCIRRCSGYDCTVWLLKFHWTCLILHALQSLTKKGLVYFVLGVYRHPRTKYRYVGDSFSLRDFFRLLIGAEAAWINLLPCRSSGRMVFPRSSDNLLYFYVPTFMYLSYYSGYECKWNPRVS